MRIIDVAVFMLIFELVGNMIFVNYAKYFGFGEVPLLQIHLEGEKPIEEQQKEAWKKAEDTVNVALGIQLLGIALLSAVFGYYYIIVVLAMIAVVTFLMPQLKLYVSGIQIILIALGIPAELAALIVTIYHFLLALVIFFWISGRGGVVG